MAYRFGTSMEDICIKKIKGGIRGIKNGTKTPQEAEVGKFLNKLKPLNEGMHEDLLSEYAQVYKDWKNKQDS